MKKLGVMDFSMSKIVLIIVALLGLIVVLLFVSGFMPKILGTGSNIGTVFANFFEDLCGLPKSQITFGG